MSAFTTVWPKMGPPGHLGDNGPAVPVEHETLKSGRDDDGRWKVEMFMQMTAC